MASEATQMTIPERRALRRVADYRQRLAEATTVRERARVVGDYIAAAVNERTYDETRACQELDRLAEPVLNLIRDPEEGPHDHSR